MEDFMMIVGLERYTYYLVGVLYSVKYYKY